jgi:thiamine-monophosphate kinase
VGLSQGLADGCAGTGAGVVGGDLSSGPLVVVSVTALGDLAGRRPVLRSGARPSDVVALAGTLGRSAAGLALLQSGWPDAGSLARGWADRPQPDPAAVAAAAGLVSDHRRPRPPYEAGPEAAQAGASAMLDVSDGLLRDAGRIAEASGVVVDLSVAQLGRYVEPLRLVAQALGVDPWEWVLSGGEDHGMLATFAPGAVPASFSVVGVVRQAMPEAQVLLDGNRPDSALGWDHFRP